MGVAILALIIGAIGLFQMFVMHNHGALTSYVPWGLLVGAYIYMIWIEVGTILAFIILYLWDGNKIPEKVNSRRFNSSNFCVGSSINPGGYKTGTSFPFLESVFGTQL
ncbi:MAG: hypothetical protein U5K69_14495 [Balneolaceae bacterium]|nr:hypothetical protein [Balneolaceae bacterium]